MMNSHIKENNITKEKLLNDYALQWLVTTPLYNIGEQVYALSDEYGRIYLMNIREILEKTDVYHYNIPNKFKL